MDFTTVERKPRKTTHNQDEEYIQWAREEWPTSFLRFSDRSMKKYEANQPPEKDETDEAYIKRCDDIFQVLKKKWGSCDLPILDCLDKFSYDKRHQKCEENRRKEFEIYLDKKAAQKQKETKEPPKPQFNKMEFPSLEPAKKEEVLEETVLLVKPVPFVKKPLSPQKPKKKSIKVEPEPFEVRPKIEKKKKIETNEDLELNAICASIESIKTKEKTLKKKSF